MSSFQRLNKKGTFKERKIKAADYSKASHSHWPRTQMNGRSPHEMHARIVYTWGGIVFLFTYSSYRWVPLYTHATVIHSSHPLLCYFPLLPYAVEYSQVDWHEFVLVETINFRETETGEYNNNSTVVHIMGSTIVYCVVQIVFRNCIEHHWF